MVDKSRHDIDIKRNPIERFLMKFQNLASSNRKAVLIIIAALVALAGIMVGAYAYYDNVTAAEKVKFEILLEKYSEALKKENSSEMDSILKELSDLTNSSMFGIAGKMGNYVIGNIYFDRKDYEHAQSYLKKFADKNQKSVFAPLALQKAAIALEEMGKIDDAVLIYQRLEKDYAVSIVTDLFYYNFGRIYQKKGDLANARKYFNLVISAYPQSAYAELARKRLFMSYAKE